jgi:hypothetical protein
MSDVVIRLHKFADRERADQVAEDIKNAGDITYTDASGSTVNVTVGDVTVEN